MDWAGKKNVCSAYACPALRLLGTPKLPTRLGDSSIATHDSLTKNFGVWGVHSWRCLFLFWGGRGQSASGL